MRKITLRLAGLIVFALFCCSAFSNFPIIKAQDAVAFTASTNPVFVWFFGYVGDTFYPQTQLNISTTQVLSLASNLSSEIGKSNLRLVSSVGDEPGRNLTASMIPTVSAYVSALRNDASVVYAVLDFLEYNSTSLNSICNMTKFYSQQVGVNGIFLDHAPTLYAVIGQANFSAMMQNLTDSFPTVSFIINGGLGSYENGTSFIIKPESGSTWALNTYTNPTVAQGTFDVLKPAKLAQLNTFFPGHVLEHLDSFAKNSGNPMGIFADQNSTTEETAIQYLGLTGGFPNSSSYAYNFLYPVLGAWTFNGALPPSNINYSGTLYNSLTIGNYARGTISNFTATMIEASHKIATGTTVSCSPNPVSINHITRCTADVSWVLPRFGNGSMVRVNNNIVKFSSSGLGTFVKSSEKCTVVTTNVTKCTINFKSIHTGKQTITAHYSGDEIQGISEGTTVLTIG